MRNDILPAMASNRKVQRLLNEFIDLLSEYEDAETADPAPKGSTPTMNCGGAPSSLDQVGSDPPAMTATTPMTIDNDKPVSLANSAALEIGVCEKPGSEDRDRQDQNSRDSGS